VEWYAFFIKNTSTQCMCTLGSILKIIKVGGTNCWATFFNGKRCVLHVIVANYGSGFILCGLLINSSPQVTTSPQVTICF
jgi:hypothetical protein